MGANAGGIYGAQLFRTDDRPRYRRGFSIGCAIIAFGIVCAVVRYGMQRRKNQRQRQQQQQHLEDEDGMRRLSSDEIHSHQGHGAAMMRVPTCDTVTPLDENQNDDDDDDDDADMADEGDTDETRVATSSSLSSYDKAKADGIADETRVATSSSSYDNNANADGDASDETRKSDVVVRESGELEIMESAAAYSLMEWEIGTAR